MNHLAEHHDELLIEESDVALNVVKARDYRTISKSGEPKEFEKTHHLGRRKIAPEPSGVFLVELDVCGLETVSRRGLVVKCHAPRKVVAK